MSNADMAAFARARGRALDEARTTVSAGPQRTNTMQVQLYAQDYARVKSAAVARGVPVQLLIISALNKLLEEWDLEPVGNPGAKR